MIGDLPPAWGDPTAIEQMFANLLGNALNYLDPARPGVVEVGSVSSAAERGAVNVTEDRHTYYVKDNGLGISPEHLSKVFLAFQRLHPSAAAGEGIGLPLVRRMVERHGGRIWVESVVGQGSTFFLSLPAHPGNGATGVPGQSMETRDGEDAWLSQQGEMNTWQRSRSA